MLSEHDIERLLKEADPAEAPAATGLSLDAAKRELLTGIVGAGEDAARPVKAPRRRVPRARHVAALGLACMAVGGTAVAAGVWNPGLGTDPDPSAIKENVPTTASSTVPSAVTEVVGALGREQTDADRDAEVEAALANLTGGADGVRLDSVRKVGEGAEGEATLLFSAERTDRFGTAEEPVCVYHPLVVGEDAGASCFGLSQILSGNGSVTYNHFAAGVGVFGLVPDGVTAATVRLGSAPGRTVAVHDNYFELPLSRGELVTGTVWHDANGNVIPQLPGDGVPGRWPDGYPDSVNWGY